jgi:hypothetical protein
LTSFQNLLPAYRKAARGKRKKVATAAFEFNLEGRLIEIQEQLRNGHRQPK